ncbi:polysaccharide deacetylase family protein [Thalassospira alkalitolerans]|uniref:polysaccharide deacetylase family protein n=1 Tax=Thalassospira alkalitolerans TaxID=1293890 RepID=UPI001FE98EEA|nr:polysaccharide deacetylase family protein [Thalassospira alkalitolerans]
MQSQTNGQRYFENGARLHRMQGRGMFKCMVFGAAFAVGLTFGPSLSLAQDADNTSVTANDQAPTVDGAKDTDETGEGTKTPVTMESTDTSARFKQVPTGDATSAVVFMYHRFGEIDFPSTNIRKSQFEAHINELTSSKYTVIGVPEIVSALQNGKGLPDYTVGITVDDAYRSVYDVAWPALKKHNLPMTVFVSSEQIDAGYTNYMTWDMLRDLVKDGVTIGGHTQHHSHLPSLSIEDAKAELAHSAERFKAELGFVPDIFAYPYGEASDDVIKLVREAGYKAAFGQQSGAMNAESDMMYLPRFAMNENYGELERFILAAESLPLRVSDITPSNYMLERNPPAFGFTLKEAVANIACYPSEGESTMNRLGDERVEIRLKNPVSSGRWRINCTSMGPNGRWRWFGMLYTVP